MKRLYVFLVLPLLWLTSCTDKCEETRTFRRYTPVSLTAYQVRQNVRTEGARALVKPGKIYTKDGFLFINELKEGIHVIDNRNPSAPKSIAFLRVPGNGDIAVRNSILYADSYMDLVAFDISDVNDIKLVKRVDGVFPSGIFEGGYWSYNGQSGIINDQNVDYVTETISTNCEESPTPGGGWGRPFLLSFAQTANFDASKVNTTNGVAGSMARFALYDKYLYAVNNSEMRLFNVQNPADPKVGNKIQMSWGIETIFPYRDKLFIGSQTGMHIYDNANPEKPVQLSTFQHARVCDPVVVHENTAYVTLRSGSTCQGFTNQLDVVDISNITSPRLLKSYPMRNPHGLGVDYPNLFICEGAYGLKSFNASDMLNIDKNQLQHIEGMDAYDVIPLGSSSAGNKTLLMIGKDGFYQFDYQNPRQLRLLSKIPVSRPSYY
ncbi:LVIVD repeat-containing protein [Spirosoma soli]|uniref:LVIVD repeat-containing protein n=1 Tax=Spirosoma soli TaxID=1770529 RepID=A0ABW5MBC3_9BACT